MVILVPDDNQCTYWELDNATDYVLSVLCVLWLCRDCVHGCDSVPWSCARWGLLVQINNFQKNLLTIFAPERNIPVSDN